MKISLRNKNILLIIFIAFLVILFNSISDDKAFNFLDLFTVPTESNLVHGTLSNGLSYSIMPHKNPGDQIYLRMIVKGGPCLETENEYGYSHLVEHLAYDGTPNFTQGEIDQWLDSLGTNNDSNSGAFTSYRNVSYRIKVPSDSQENLAKAFNVFSDWINPITYTEESLRKQTNIITEEIRRQFTPLEKANAAHYDIEQNDINTYVDTIMGSVEILEKATPRAVSDFHDYYYRPQYITIVVVGACNPETVKKMIEDKFKVIPSRDSIPMFNEYYNYATKFDTDYSVVRESDLFRLSGSFRFFIDKANASNVLGHKARQEIYLIKDLLNLRLKKITNFNYLGIIDSDVKSDLYSTTRIGLEINFEAIPQEWQNIVNIIFNEIQSIKYYGFTTDEINFIKDQKMRALNYIGDHYSLFTSEFIMDELEESFVFDEPLSDIEWYKKEMTLIFSEFNTDKTIKICREILTDNSFIAQISTPVINENDYFPANEDELKKIIQACFANKETAKFNYTYASYEKQVNPVQENSIRSEKSYSLYDTKEVVCNNGIKLIFVNVENKTPWIFLNAYSPGGYYALSKSDLKYARIIQDAFTHFGSSIKEISDFNEILSRYTFTFNPWIDYSYEGISGTFFPNDKELYFSFLIDFLTNIKEDNATMNQFKISMKDIYDYNDTDTTSLFYSILDSMLNKKSLSIPSITNEVIDELSTSKLKELVVKRFQNPKDFVFVFSGNIKNTDFENVAVQYFSNIKTIPLTEAPIANTQTLEKKHSDFVFPFSKVDKSKICLIYEGLANGTYLEKTLIDAIAKLIEKKLFYSIREKEYGTYYVSSYSEYELNKDSVMRLYVEFECDPERANELKDIALQLIKDIAIKGISDDDMHLVSMFFDNNTKDVLTDPYMKNIFIQNAIISNFDLNIPLNSLYQKISVDEVSTVIKTLCVNEPSVVGMLIPLKK